MKTTVMLRLTTLACILLVCCAFLIYYDKRPSNAPPQGSKAPESESSANKQTTPATKSTVPTPQPIGKLSKFTGVITIEMVTSGNPEDGMLSGQYLKRLRTTDGDYQVITSEDTIYKGMEVSDQGVRWKIGKRYEVTGEYPSKTQPPLRLNEAKGVIDARIVELLK